MSRARHPLADGNSVEHDRQTGDAAALHRRSRHAGVSVRFNGHRSPYDPGDREQVIGVNVVVP